MPEQKKKSKKIACYIHLPWCVQRCPYCDFNAHALKGKLQAKAYHDALIMDIKQTQKQLTSMGHDHLSIDSVFFGGGTPSLMPAWVISSVLEALSLHFHLDEDAEITLEANPGSSDHKHFKGYRQAGVNRLSLGVQSFDNDCLKALGRIHDAKQAIQSFWLARELGYENINLDIMVGLPGKASHQAAGKQSLLDLQTAIDLDAEHISWYELTMEPNTLFAARPPKLPSEHIREKIDQQGKEMLKQAGFAQYEISAYAKEGKNCRHNLHYWLFDDYLGFGAGAHGKWTLADQRIIRQIKHKHPTAFMQSAHKIQDQKQIQQPEHLLEYMINRLRLLKPILPQELKQQGFEFEKIRTLLAPAFDHAWVIENPENLMVTDLGRRWLSDLQALFLKS
jgi:putative oxygen-independent coproporphyrinogen III oxidase